MARTTTRTLKTADLLSNQLSAETPAATALAEADAIADIKASVGEIDISGLDEPLTPDEIAAIGQRKVEEIIAKSKSGPKDNSAPPMTEKAKDRVLNSQTGDTSSASVIDDSPKAKPPKKGGVCLFSGLPTSGGEFRPGGDAKLKSALIQRFRGQVPNNIDEMSDALRAQFLTGDLSTPEGAEEYAISRNWGQFLTTKAAKQKAAKDDRTPYVVLEHTIADAIRKYGVFTEPASAVIVAAMQAIEEFLPTDEEDESEDESEG